MSANSFNKASRQAIASDPLPSDAPIWGDRGPLQQNEKESPQTPAMGQLTFDTNLHAVLGSQSLVNAGRVKVETANPPDVVWTATFTKVGDNVMVPVNGAATIAIQPSGTWAGTLTFYVSLNGQVWNAINVRRLDNAVAWVTTSTGNYPFQAAVAGFTFFRVSMTAWTSGVCVVQMQASTTPSVPGGSFVLGSGSTTLVQRASPYELLTYDSSTAPSNALIKDALQAADPWNTRASYNIGDTVLFNGQIYRCLTAHSGATANAGPVASTANWQVDERQNKSLVTREYLSPPAASRLRIEHDLDAYQYRLQESLLITQRLQAQNDMVSADYALTISQDLGYADGKRFALGASGMSTYNFEEIR